MSISQPIPLLLSFGAFNWLGSIGFEAFGTCTARTGQHLNYSYGMYECTDNQATASYYDSETCDGDAGESTEISNSTCNGDSGRVTTRCIDEGEGRSSHGFIKNKHPKRLNRCEAVSVWAEVMYMYLLFNKLFAG